MKEYNFVITDEDEGIRVDKYLADIMPDLSRSYIQKQIEDGNLLINGKASKSNYKLKADDEIEFTTPDSIVPDIEPENIPLKIVYEDDDVAIVSKPQGMVVHPSAGHYSGTLVNAILYHMNGRLSGINGVMRPGIVHRIDKDTSGLLIICKNDASHNSIATQLKEHSINRIYYAIVHGVVKDDEGTVDAPMARSKVDRKKMCIDQSGKRAVTHYTVLERFNGYSLIKCKLETGRTHQIRVHMASIGHPLMGDPVYLPQKEPIHCNGQMLHAMTIGFVGPSDGIYKEFSEPLPEYFEKALKYLRSK